MLRIQTILHPTDFSDTSDQALQLAHALARDHKAKLILVTVAAPPPPPAMPPLPDLPYISETVSTEFLESARRQLAPLASRITDVPVETQVLTGLPGVAIVSAARDWNADLIVMGSHGRTGIGRLLMGSIAEHVLRHATCPVLTIRPGTSQHLSQ